VSFNSKNIAEINKKINEVKIQVILEGSLKLHHSLDLFAYYMELGNVSTARFFIEDEEKGIFSKPENTSIPFYYPEYLKLISRFNKGVEENPHFNIENFKNDVLRTDSALHAFRSQNFEKAAKLLSECSEMSKENLYFQGLKLISDSTAQDFAYEYKNELLWQRHFTSKVRKYLENFLKIIGGKEKITNHVSEVLVELIKITNEINADNPFIRFREKDYLFSEKESKTMQLFVVMATFVVALKQFLGTVGAREMIRYYIFSAALEELAVVWSESPYVDRLFEIIELVENPVIYPKATLE
jgi:hypothetical protein